MSKKKIFIILTHVHSLKPRSNNEWETTETLEFQDQLRNRHYSYASAIGDYVNSKMIIGVRAGMTEYSNFDKYVRDKYPKQMAELDASYGHLRVVQPVVEDDIEEKKITDNFGNIREKTVFDV